MKGGRRRPSFSPTPIIPNRRKPLSTVDNSLQNRDKYRLSKQRIAISIPNLDFSYAPEIYDHLYSRQVKQDMLSEIVQSGITPDMRSQLISWMFTICSNFKIPRDIIFCAISILDRSLCKLGSDKEKFQLLGATAIFVSAKMQSLKIIPIAELINECANAYTSKDFIECENNVLVALNYDVNVPTVADFLEMSESATIKFKPLHSLLWLVANILIQFSSFLRFKASTISTAIIIPHMITSIIHITGALNCPQPPIVIYAFCLRRNR